MPVQPDPTHRTDLTNTDAMAGFVHLHVHSEYSPLDGTSSIADIVAKAVADGQPAVSVTDHGTLGGVWQLAKTAKAAGVKPLIGIEAYLAVMANPAEEPDRFAGQSTMVDRDDASAADDDGRAETPIQKTKKYEHLTIFATTKPGWRNLSVMMSKAEESFYAKPLIDYKLLKQYSEGLLVLTGCIGGPVMGPVSRGNLDQARLNLDRIIDAVGHDRVFVEVMEHGIDAERKALRALHDLAVEYNLPMVATNDSHYTEEADRDMHAAWLANGSKKTLTDPKKFQFHGEGFHLRTEAEMRALRPAAWWQTACDNTVAIASMFEDDILPTAVNRLPAFPLPDGFETERDFAEHLIAIGWAKRSKGTDIPADLPADVRARLDLELSIIEDQGFLSYFFIVWDLIMWAREDGNLPGLPQVHGIYVGPGRGSAAGSMFSYLLEIVDIDPIRHNLLFERFMEPGRTDMPDIDVDFEAEHVDRVRSYLAHKWGSDKVARIGTHAVAKTKLAIKDAARVLDLTPLGNKLNGAISKVGKTTFGDLSDLSHKDANKFRDVLSGFGADGQGIMNLAGQFYGTLKGEGIHACGILIATEPLREMIPLRRDRKKSNGVGLEHITMWDAPDVGDIAGGGIGLLKVDVLSLRNLDSMHLAVQFILETTGEVIDPRNLPDPDSKGDPRVDAAWSLLRAGKTAGLFQLESQGMKKVAQAVAPDCLTDLSAILALFRPGPLGAGMDRLYAERKAGTSAVNYDQFTSDPAEQDALNSVLGETYGVWVFQEQLMRLGTVVAGFDVKQRAKLRKAVGKKDASVMALVSAEFLEGAVKEFRDEQGKVTSIAFSKETAQRLINEMQASASYLFNASHSAAYAYISYMTAFLKANWPTEYGAAVLATTKNSEKRLAMIEALQSEGIEVLAPDVNRSRKGTAPEGEMKIRLGLTEIKGVGVLGETVVDIRERDGVPFDSLSSLVVRLTDDKVAKVNITAIEGLIEAGACDSFDAPRLGQMMVVRAVRTNPDITIPVDEFTPLEQSMRQRKRLGLAIGIHPTSSYAAELKEWRVPRVEGEDGKHVGQRAYPISRIKGGDDGKFVLVAAVLAEWDETSYSGGQMARITLEGKGSRINGVMWNSALAAVTEPPVVGSIVGVWARVVINQREVFDEDGEYVETITVTELNLLETWTIDVDAKELGPAPGRPPVPALEVAAATTVSRPVAVMGERQSKPATGDPETPAATPVPVSVVDGAMAEEPTTEPATEKLAGFADFKKSFGVLPESTVPRGLSDDEEGTAEPVDVVLTGVLSGLRF